MTRELSNGEQRTMSQYMSKALPKGNKQIKQRQQLFSIRKLFWTYFIKVYKPIYKPII